MRTIWVDVNCQVCKRPNKVEVEPSPQDDEGNDLVDLKPFLAMYCCDNCMVDKGYMRRKQLALPVQATLPHND